MWRRIGARSKSWWSATHRSISGRINASAHPKVSTEEARLKGHRCPGAAEGSSLLKRRHRRGTRQQQQLVAACLAIPLGQQQETLRDTCPALPCTCAPAQAASALRSAPQRRSSCRLVPWLLCALGRWSGVQPDNARTRYRTFLCMYMRYRRLAQGKRGLAVARACPRRCGAPLTLMARAARQAACSMPHALGTGYACDSHPK